MPNVSVFRGNELTAEDVLAIGADAVVLATGSHWVQSGIGRSSSEPFAGADSASVFTPDDIMAGLYAHLALRAAGMLWPAWVYLP